MKAQSLAMTLVGALALTACAPEAAEDDAAVEATETNAALEEVLAHERRDEDRARDQYRNPAETLAFFDVRPEHTVIEYAPGGGWYTRVLAPYVIGEGSYIGVGFAPEGIDALGDEFAARVRTGGENFPATQSEALGIPAEDLPFYFGNAIPEDLAGTVDRVLIFRMMHNLIRWDIADAEVDALAATLKPDGLLGVVQHRAKPDAPEDYVDGNRGYLKEADLIAFFEGKGFELVGTSEVNANPNDTADYESGVWTLPPSFALGEENRETYAAIGESDRMTLLFRRAE